MIPAVLYWSVNTEHLYSTSSCTNSQHPLGDVSVSLLAMSWHFSHALDSLLGGTSAAHVGHAKPSAGMGCSGGWTSYGWGDRHTPCCWRGQVRPCKQWESWQISESTVVQKGARHKSTGNQAISLALLFMELCVLHEDHHQIWNFLPYIGSAIPIKAGNLSLQAPWPWNAPTGICIILVSEYCQSLPNRVSATWAPSWCLFKTPALALQLALTLTFQNVEKLQL